MNVEDNTLSVDELGFVIGSAMIPIDEDYYVSIGVTSYEFDGDRINHVPSVILCKNGKVVHEAEPHDSLNPERAIENAISSGKYLASTIEHYI